MVHAGERRSHLDLRLPQASDPRRGAAAQGRRLEGAGRDADHGGFRRHHRLCRRRQGLRQRHPDRPRRRQGDRLRAYEPLRADHEEGPRRCMPAMSSAMSARPACRPARTCISSSTRMASPIDPLGGSATALAEGTSDEDYAPADAGRRRRREDCRQRRPTALPSKSWSTGSSMWRAAAPRAPRTRNRRPPGLASSSSRPGCRMMKSYHPELFRSMSTEDLLALRFDPTISREMVANLARENEARLRQYGHSITAGRLYLAHFLGVGRRASGAGGVRRGLDRRADGRVGDQRQPVPDRQELRVRDRLGGKEDERQGGDLFRRRRRSKPRPS